jgi:8-oxo-dGTP pyrophosphatase MutT (NUDIX family)
MTKKTLSAGVIVTDGIQLLLCHVTGARHYDLPKGKVDPGENDLQAAVRELQEETSMIVEPHKLYGLGQFPYKKTKDLSLWLYRVEKMPDPRTLVCRSTFDSGKGVMRTEMDGFACVAWGQVSEYVVPDMLVVLRKVYGTITHTA